VLRDAFPNSRRLTGWLRKLPTHRDRDNIELAKIGIRRLIYHVGRFGFGVLIPKVVNFYRVLTKRSMDLNPNTVGLLDVLTVIIILNHGVLRKDRRRELMMFDLFSSQTHCCSYP
jgi:hypothetical protein